MTQLSDYLGKPFDVLYAITSDDAEDHGTYADTRTNGGVYSITSTQSGATTYGAYDGGTDRHTDETAPARATETDDCEDPQTCPDCTPVAADD